MSSSKKTTKQKTINLALQGGGSHGAFAWGVLDYLLEDGRINVEGIAATSAGTMNACAYAYGLHQGGPDAARQAMHDFWWNVHQASATFGSTKSMPWDKLFDSSSFLALDAMTRMFSPYQFNPFDFNPLRDILDKTIDFDALQKCDCVKLFISTTHIHSGKTKIFNTDEISLDVAMASACLPFVFKAVTVDGEDYWDGGYMGNPALYPLFYETDSRDIMIVHINPIVRNETPTTAPEIMNRINEITFNASLLKDMRAIAFVKKLLENDMIKAEFKDHFKNILLHSIRAEEAMTELSVASKFDSDWDFLTGLRDKGRDTMKIWLDNNFDKIGEEDTVDLNVEFLNSVTQYFDDDKRA